MNLSMALVLRVVATTVTLAAVAHSVVTLNQKIHPL